MTTDDCRSLDSSISSSSGEVSVGPSRCYPDRRLSRPSISINDDTTDYRPTAWNPISSSPYLYIDQEDLEEMEHIYGKDPPSNDMLISWDNNQGTCRTKTVSGVTASTEETTSEQLSEVEEDDFEPCEEHYRVPKDYDFIDDQQARQQQQQMHLVVHKRKKEKSRDPPSLSELQPVEHISNQLAIVPVPDPDPHKYNGFHHQFITVREDHRFLLLYTFLKRNINSKIIVYFSTTKSTQYYSKLLQKLKFESRCAHNGQSTEDFMEDYLGFFKQKSGVLCLNDFQGNEFAVPPSVSWIVQFEPPGNPSEYIFRVGRISSECSRSVGRALIFLTPHQFGFLKYLKSARVKFYEYVLPKLSNIQNHLERLVRKDERLSKVGREAYHSYLMNYSSHEYRDIYNVHDLDQEKTALSFGFAVPPSKEKHVANTDVSRSAREDSRWKPVKRDGGPSWMTKEKTWRHADRHATSMTSSRRGQEGDRK